jgi:xylan 1,4-beta-xylosidase
VEVWLDRSGGGRRVASCELRSTGGWERWQTIRCPLRATGTHDVYLQVKGGKGELLRLASLRFAAR